MTFFHCKPVASKQSGVALVVALVFLLTLTVIGIATLSTNNIEARMAYSFSDYNRAFQAAEAGVAEGERWLDSQSHKPIAGTGCMTGASFCLTWSSEPASQISNWVSFPWTTRARTYGYVYSETASPVAREDHLLARASEPPAYVIEDIGEDSSSSLVVGIGPSYSRNYYRVTAHGTGAQSNTATTTQSVYARSY